MILESILGCLRRCARMTARAESLQLHLSRMVSSSQSGFVPTRAAYAISPKLFSGFFINLSPEFPAISANDSAGNPAPLLFIRRPPYAASCGFKCHFCQRFHRLLHLAPFVFRKAMQRWRAVAVAQFQWLLLELVAMRLKADINSSRSLCVSVFSNSAQQFRSFG